MTGPLMSVVLPSAWVVLIAQCALPVRVALGAPGCATRHLVRIYLIDNLHRTRRILRQGPQLMDWTLMCWAQWAYRHQADSAE